MPAHGAERSNGCTVLDARCRLKMAVGDLEEESGGPSDSIRLTDWLSCQVLGAFLQRFARGNARAEAARCACLVGVIVLERWAADGQTAEWTLAELLDLASGLVSGELEADKGPSAPPSWNNSPHQVQRSTGSGGCTPDGLRRKSYTGAGTNASSNASSPSNCGRSTGSRATLDAARKPRSVWRDESSDMADPLLNSDGRGGLAKLPDTQRDHPATTGAALTEELEPAAPPSAGVCDVVNCDEHSGAMHCPNGTGSGEFRNNQNSAPQSPNRALPRATRTGPCARDRPKSPSSSAGATNSGQATCTLLSRLPLRGITLRRSGSDGASHGTPVSGTRGTRLRETAYPAQTPIAAKRACGAGGAFNATPSVSGSSSQPAVPSSPSPPPSEGNEPGGTSPYVVCRSAESCTDISLAPAARGATSTSCNRSSGARVPARGRALEAPVAREASATQASSSRGRRTARSPGTSAGSSPSSPSSPRRAVQAQNQDYIRTGVSPSLAPGQGGRRAAGAPPPRVAGAAGPRSPGIRGRT